jgi:hypothetical protein
VIYRGFFKESSSLLFKRTLITPTTSIRNMTITNNSDQANWRAALEALPAGGRIPAFFFAHGCTLRILTLLTVAPLLIWPERLPSRLPLDSIGGPKGPNANFLRDFGQTLIEKYNPKAIVVFSAHWETHGHIEGISPVENHLTES